MAATTAPGAASCASLATTAESRPPLSSTTRPRAPAEATCCRIQRAMVSALATQRFCHRGIGPGRLRCGDVTSMRQAALKERRLGRPEGQLHAQTAEHVQLADREAGPHRRARTAGARSERRVYSEHSGEQRDVERVNANGGGRVPPDELYRGR